ncbi:Metabotropic glutamate receptor 2,Metabotropic glutamate receptor 3,Metabotropic glutamate receptor 8,Metabotropic glutamate receptor 4,Metabotropic glutamate receptor 5,Metabotropic glutamate receptor 6 [Mytilus coruscus]|uniref:G-protein coupled receptors family 3 profile domain-containing protein n=1 Tax=Mytilus coruscus TaxID=42192 RepID=A0A6J8EEW1_MYTCO|nr:Metabotropic glutamate receptor 2,Metabotropic glutamate receptor 3,Metabotropic glutamate receptor 8,Metabotropic glutamate receptor 4,Metabotropic glutamate receptor 5,Metabotropic glutamate receptor 6 [Mytilus coruscus]
MRRNVGYFVVIIHSVVLASLHKDPGVVYVGKYGNYTWPRHDLQAEIPGEIILGALHMVHERSDNKICGPIMPQGGIQALECMMYSLDRINEGDFLPGFSIGVLSKDDCDRDIYGLEQAVDFIRGSVANVGGSEVYKCDDESDPIVQLPVIPGVIGAPSSVTSIQVATLLKLFEIPQISFFSTSSVLSSRDRYPYFLRTIPSDVNQAQAMVEIVRMLNWTYVSVVYEESSYGIQGFNELEKLLKEANICIATTEKLTKDSGVAGQDTYDDIVDKLKLKPNARGVIIFGSDQEVGELMEAVKRRNATGMFTWIGSDGWGGRGLAYHGKEEQVEGAITTQPLAYEVKGFKNYFLKLKPGSNHRNPWFIEYWEQQFKCKYPGSPWTPYNENFIKDCTGNESFDLDTFDMEAQLQFVSDAVLAFAYAIKNMHQTLCPNTEGLCDAMNPIDGEKLKKFLLEVQFKGLSGDDFQFLPNGDGPARYRILNFHQKDKGVYEWSTVGYFKNGNLTEMQNLTYRLDEPMHPPSVCSHPCGPGEATQLVEGDSCCWTCMKCHTYQYMPSKSECVTCPMGTIPIADKSYCQPIPQKFLDYDDALSFSAMIVATLGLAATSTIMITFLRYSATPIVKASGRELSFVLLVGIFLCYSMTFILVSKPTEVSCGAQKFGIGLCFSIVYSAILTKTNRIYRIFKAGKRTTKRPKFISPKSQLVICGSLVAVQNAVGIVWVLLRPPKVISYYANRDDHQLVCNDAVEAWYMVGFTYPIFLIIVCTFFAFLTRNIPEAFNESKHIGLTMYTTCIIWLAFVPIFFSTADEIDIRIATMSFAISLSATVALACMFAPKSYIIIFHSERNVRQSLMAAKPVMSGPVVQNNYRATKCNIRIDTDSKSYQGSDMELTHRLRTSGSCNSLCSRSTNLTQANGISISTQTLNFPVRLKYENREPEQDQGEETEQDQDVQL